MKNILLLALIVGTAFSVNAANKIPGKSLLLSTPSDTTVGINFYEGTWAEVLELAQAEDKLIFLDAYASWCGPCKMMTRRTFPDPAVGEFFNANFINYKMDMEKHPEGKRLSSKFHLISYPTFYFLNFSEEIVHQKSAYLKPSPFISLGKKALKINAKA